MAGLANTFGRGVMTNHWTDYQFADAWLVIGGNPAENHPIAFKWITKARETRGAKLIVVDPRVSKTASLADIYAPFRPGTDIPFFNGFMKYILDNNLYHEEYVVNYTNASYIINPDFKLEDGVFSGLLEGGKYDKATWSYTDEKDVTLQHPNCVFQLLKKHVARYDLKTVSRICGTPQDKLVEVWKAFAETGKPGKAGSILYAMGMTQHTVGTQNVRALAMIQLLLGNMGMPGGGVNAQRGEANVQGSTDQGMLFHITTGYNPMPSAAAHPTWADYVEKATPKAGYWTNRPKFVAAMFKAWYGGAATEENDYRFDWMPKLATGDHSHMAIFRDIALGKIKGLFAWGQNAVVCGPSQIQARAGMAKLEWLVAMDLFETETAAFWKAPDLDAAKIGTEVFLLPAAGPFEKEGTVTNSGRWIQWRYKAVDPPGEAKPDLWIADRLFKTLRAEYKTKGGAFPDAILNMVWDYGDPPDPNKVAMEMNGTNLETGELLPNFAAIANSDLGAVSCGNWIYSGFYNNVNDPACKRRNKEDKSGLAMYHNWAWAWPLNRRIVYNRCSCDPAGRPWDPTRAPVEWDGAQWVLRDVPDFNAKVPPEETAAKPFIMLADGQGLLFSIPCADGPFPEHYEPIESPVKNLVSKQQTNPCLKTYGGEFQKFAEVGSTEFPYVCTTLRLVEHYQSGGLTRNLPFLVELQPEMHVMISKSLGEKLGIESYDWVKVSTVRGAIECKVGVTPLVKPLEVDGKPVEIIYMPWHWGFIGLSSGAIANDLTPAAGDPNTMIPEYKAFLVNIEKVRAGVPPAPRTRARAIYDL